MPQRPLALTHAHLPMQHGSCKQANTAVNAAYLCEPAKVAQHCENGFACFVQLESCTSLEVTVYEPKLSTNSFFALRCWHEK